jgi:superoxide dismutase
MTEYTLPDLPYDYGALAPHITGEIWSCTTPSTTRPTSTA